MAIRRTPPCCERDDRRGPDVLEPHVLGVEPATYEDGGKAFAPLKAELEGGLAAGAGAG